MPTSFFQRFSRSRRDFLHRLASFGAVVPASALLTGMQQAIALQKSVPKPTAPKSGSKSGDFAFTDVTAQAGLAGAINVFGGVTHKRWLLEEIGCGIDIFMVNGTRFDDASAQPPASNFLFHNNRDGSFTDVTQKAGLTRAGWGQGCCVGDYDNDGYDDLVVTYWGGIVLYHNNSDGTFTDVTERAGLVQTGSTSRWNTGCSFLDYDRDGHLDLFVANYVTFDPARAPQS